MLTQILQLLGSLRKSYQLNYLHELKMFNSSSFISVLISSNKTLDIYLSAVSGNIHKIFEFGVAFFATATATANVEPPDTPVIIPSFLANSLAQNIPSWPDTGINSSK